MLMILFILFVKCSMWCQCEPISQQTFTCSKSAIETLEKRCEICSKLTTNIPERRQRRSNVVLVFSEQANNCWVHNIALFPSQLFRGYRKRPVA